MVPQNDDSSNDSKEKESRPPTINDLVNLCKEMNSRGAKYVVIGGMAMLQQGFVRATEDIDLLIETSLKNEKAVLEALSKLPDQAAKEIKPGEISEYEVIRVADEIVVDLMKTACGIDYTKASKKIIRVKIQDVEIPFANADLLIQMKQSVRPKDQMDLEFLKTLKKQKNKT